MVEKPTYEELVQRVQELEQAESKRKTMEENNRMSSELLAFFIKHSPIYAFLKKVSHKDSQVIYASDNYVDMIGVPASQMVGKTMHELFPHDFADKITRDDIATIKNGKNLKLDEELNGRNYVTYKFPLKQGGDKYLAGYTIDITDLKKTEEDLAQIFSMSLDMICIADINTATFIKVNPAFTEILGYSEEELLEKPSLAFIHPEDLDVTRSIIGQKLQMGANIINFENRYRCKDGNYRWLSWVSHPNTEKGVAYAVARDITDLKHNEEALKKSNALLDATGRMARVGGWELNADTMELTWTEETYRIHEVPLDHKPGLREAITFFHPEDRPQLKLAIKRALKHGEPYDMEVRFITAQGNHLWTRTICQPEIINGKSVRLMGTFQDITENKRAEKEREELEGKLRQAHKMEAVGRLAGGVAHDFNNMLSVIIGHAGMAMEDVNPSLPLYERLEEIKKAGERSADLTRQLLAFARKQTISPKVIDINKTVMGVTMMLKRLIGEDIDLAWLPGSKVWPVKMDPSQIDQIMANLCVNARDAIADVGKVTIETGNAVFDETYCADHRGFIPGEYVLLTISDNGCGMDAETLDRIFEPFFTTKEFGRGTGLGLATVYGVVKQNNGFVYVYSEPNQGTTFKIYLPRYRTKADFLPEKVKDLPTERGRETILLVEDEAAILHMTTMMLERLGYQVLATRTPGEAIRLAQEYVGEIQLLVTDVVMPEMNGRDLAKNILSTHPNIKRLFMSGYTANVIAHHGVLDKGVNFIQKPFSRENLGAKVRAVLDYNK